ncbi:MAG: glycosyltransferase [Rickettsiaceae bacterium]|jgi:glycosyltransferase involved in cell wall biosynthesis|nr:glycosyltransferase [Rickettsiaceae bacterium]
MDKNFIFTKPKPKISIIVPVYNGEKYIAKTIESILAQTYTDFELVCVDDSSTDGSYEILTHYAKQDQRIRLFKKPNGGNAVKSIIWALPMLLGEYMFYSSHDDLFSKDLLEKMYDKAINSGADAVLPDMFCCKNGETYSRIIGVNGDRDVELCNRDAFLLSLDWLIHGFSLRKMDLVKKIGYDDIATNSDEYITRKFYLNCNKVVFCNGIFFYNHSNIEALTQKFTIKKFDWIVTNTRILELIIKNDFDKKIIEKFIKNASADIYHIGRLLNKNLKKFPLSDAKKAKNILRDNLKEINKISRTFNLKPLKLQRRIKVSLSALVLFLLIKKRKIIGCS